MLLLRRRSDRSGPEHGREHGRGVIRRVRRAARRTIRLHLSQRDLEPIGSDIDRLLLEADDLSLSPESQNLLLALDDEISRGLAATSPNEDEPGT